MATAREKRQAERWRDAKAGGKGQTAREKAREKREKKEKKRKRRKSQRRVSEPAKPKGPVVLPKIDLTTGAKKPVQETVQPKPTEPVVLPKITLEPKKETIIEKIKGARETALEEHPVQTRLAEAGTIMAGTALAGLGIGAALGLGGKAAASTTIMTKTGTGAMIGKAAPSTGVALNTKTIGLSSSWLTKLLTKTSTSTITNVATGTSKVIQTAKISKVGIAAFVAGLAGYAVSTGIGRQQMSEGTEGIQIVMRDALRQAQETGNWEAYDEAAAIRDEILNMSTAEKIASWTPLSLFLGAAFKLKSAAGQAVLMDKVAKDMQTQQETGETDSDKWARIREEQAEQDKSAIDYYNKERMKLVEWEREADIAARKEDAAFWRAERAKQTQKEAEDRKAIADFWTAYKKEAYKLSQENRPSNLNFGLL